VKAIVIVFKDEYYLEYWTFVINVVFIECWEALIACIENDKNV
jgi:hypothetical protein